MYTSKTQTRGRLGRDFSGNSRNKLNINKIVLYNITFLEEVWRNWSFFKYIVHLRRSLDVWNTLCFCLFVFKIMRCLGSELTCYLPCAQAVFSRVASIKRKKSFTPRASPASNARAPWVLLPVISANCHFPKRHPHMILISGAKQHSWISLDKPRILYSF